MRMQKRQFRIGELAKKLSVEKFVIRFWEKEFDIKTTRSNGGQRFYDENAEQQFNVIKTLLYDKKFTIKGAKNYINEEHKKGTIIGSSKVKLASPSADLTRKLALLQQQLLKLQKLLT